MNVAQYTFQSPYSSPVQVGHLDPSSVNKDSSQGDTSSLLKSTNPTLSKAQSLESSLKSDVKPTVASADSLDVYA